MAIYIHRFEFDSEFQNERKNNYKEPWVSLTKKTSGLAKSFVINPEGEDVTYYFCYPYSGEFMWSTYYSELTITAVDANYKTITASGLTFDCDGDYGEDLMGWYYNDKEEGVGFWGYTNSLEPSAGDTFYVVQAWDSNGDLYKWYATDTRDLSEGYEIEWCPDEGDCFDTPILSVTYEGGEDINRIDYNKEPCFMPQFVDLGLPSGLLWASCNLGASRPEEFGDYYAWGEIETKDPSNFTLEDYRFYPEDFDYHYGHLAKYNVYDEKTTLDPEDDVAQVMCCEGVHIPNYLDINELIDYTTPEIVTVNGVEGVRMTSTENGNSIFIPNGGWYGNGEHVYDYGKLWGCEVKYGTAVCFGFCDAAVVTNILERWDGVNIRPVLGESNVDDSRGGKLAADIQARDAKKIDENKKVLHVKLIKKKEDTNKEEK